MSGQPIHAFGTAKQIVRDPETAEDLLQEALLECYVNISDLRSSDSILAWIRGTIRNRCFNYLRRHRTVPFPFARFEQEPTQTPSPLDHVESVEEHGHLRKALDSLSEKNRRATELFYVQEKSVEEVAHILGISPVATRVRLNRSRALLRELLTQVVSRSVLKQEATMAKPERMNTEDLKCSFCRKSVEDLELLITGPGVHICSSCVQACMTVMIRKHGYALQLAPQLSDSVLSRISCEL